MAVGSTVKSSCNVAMTLAAVAGTYSHERRSCRHAASILAYSPSGRRRLAGSGGGDHENTASSWPRSRSIREAAMEIAVQESSPPLRCEPIGKAERRRHSTDCRKRYPIRSTYSASGQEPDLWCGFWRPVPGYLATPPSLKVSVCAGLKFDNLLKERQSLLCVVRLHLKISRHQGLVKPRRIHPVTALPSRPMRCKNEPLPVAMIDERLNSERIPRTE